MIPLSKEIITLTGSSLTLEDVYKIAVKKVEVQLCPLAMQKVNEARNILVGLLDSNTPIYGLNRGVGANKDKRIQQNKYEQYNRNLILSHNVSIGSVVSEEIVRATMAIRLNTLLIGCTGIQQEIVKMYQHFLNKQIHPVMFEKGSIGVCDIANLSQIGLSMIGEGDVFYKGERLSALEVLRKEKLTPIQLGPKDGLTIVSSNAYAAGIAALTIKRVFHLLETADIIYALSMEGYKANVSPLDIDVYKVRPFPGQNKSVNNIQKYLEGSYLWSVTDHLSLQDPLSFRSACQVHGSVRDALKYVADYLHLQVNSSDDNPTLLVERKEFVACSNFDILPWVLGFEMLGNACNHMAKISCYRTLKLGSEDFTGLSRFLTPKNETIAYGAIQKTCSALVAEIRHLSNPSTSDYIALAEEIEDHATNSIHVLKRINDIIDNIYYLLAIEAIHAAQAIDLRGEIHLGIGTKKAYELIRATVPFLQEDRNLTIDIENMNQLLNALSFVKDIKESLTSAIVE